MVGYFSKVMCLLSLFIFIAVRSKETLY
jgi:hypothetical protein